jgi:uncharacterized membrane protein YhaH (DUF805 family)
MASSGRCFFLLPPSSEPPYTQIRRIKQKPETRKDPPMNWYIDAWKNYVNFQGRARRKAFWMFALFNIIAIVALTFVEGLIGLRGEGGYGILSGLYSLAVILPALALAVRRLHDTGRSGWWILLGLIPLVGPIVLIVFYVTDSQPGTNQYGPNPKGA